MSHFLVLALCFNSISTNILGTNYIVYKQLNAAEFKKVLFQNCIWSSPRKIIPFVVTPFSYVSLFLDMSNDFCKHNSYCISESKIKGKNDFIQTVWLTAVSR